MGSTRFRSLKEAREVAFEHTRTARLGGDPRAPVATDVPTFGEAATVYPEIQFPTGERTTPATSGGCWSAMRSRPSGTCR